MKSNFDIKADIRFLPNIVAAAAWASAAYDSVNCTDAKSGEGVLIQDCDNCFVISFPGTHDFKDLLRDVECELVETTILGKTVKVHEGFDRSHRALIDRIKEVIIPAASGMNKPVYIVGHSKGAAVAKRCALALWGIVGVKIQGVITFGEPRGGDKRYAALYETLLGKLTVRITNAADPITWLTAWLLGNRHCGVEGFLPRGENQIVYGAKFWWKVLKNFGEIWDGWKALVWFRQHPLDLVSLVAIGSPIKDHHIKSYIGRINALT